MSIRHILKLIAKTLISIFALIFFNLNLRVTSNFDPYLFLNHFLNQCFDYWLQNVFSAAVTNVRLNRCK